MNAPLVPIRPESVADLPSYEAARAALALCASIDEAKHILDRAAQLAAYALLRDDDDMVVWLQEIRLRASIRVGEIVSDLDRAKAGRPKNNLPSGGEISKDAAIVSAGLSSGTAYRLQDLAELVGTRDRNNEAAGTAAAERYFAQCRQAGEPATDKGLRAAVVTAVQAAMGPTEIRRAAKVLSREDLAVKQRRRDEREVLLGERSRRASARLGTTLYPVIYADPPWSTEAWSADTGKGRAPDNHYPTMSLDEICALPVPAAPNAVLFLWVPANLLPAGCRVVEAWGFSYSTTAVWEKPFPITGYWFRSRHEQLFVGTRGHDFVAPALGTQAESVIKAALERRRHSEKPAAFAELIERYYPTAPKLELFARAARPGWDTWGNEVPLDDEGDATPDDGAAAPLDVGADIRADRGTS